MILEKLLLKLDFWEKLKKSLEKKFNLTKLNFDLFNFEHNLFSTYGQLWGHWMTSQQLGLENEYALEQRFPSWGTWEISRGTPNSH